MTHYFWLWIELLFFIISIYMMLALPIVELLRMLRGY
jgi:hypothetical protein